MTSKEEIEYYSKHLSGKMFRLVSDSSMKDPYRFKIGPIVRDGIIRVNVRRGLKWKPLSVLSIKDIRHHIKTGGYILKTNKVINLIENKDEYYRGA